VHKVAAVKLLEVSWKRRQAGVPEPGKITFLTALGNSPMTAWVLPDQIADVLPSEARHIEELRRKLLDAASRYGYELVMPPLVEHIDSLLTGTGQALDLQTFKLVDQLSGRTLGVRADTTPQVARIDAHLLNRNCVTRLCYCGPVLHTRQDKPHATREPLQMGAEIYGHAGPEADLEAQQLAIDCLAQAGVHNMTLDMSDVGIVVGILAPLELTADVQQTVMVALGAKDKEQLMEMALTWPQAVRAPLLGLLDLYGDASVLLRARDVLPKTEPITQALNQLQWLASHIQAHNPQAQIRFDLADVRAHAYYTGVRFAVYVQGMADALVRGGRYDEVGAVFGRKRPAVGFSLDLKELVRVAAHRRLAAAIQAPWSEDAGLRAAIASLRRQGETVVCVMPGHESEIQEFECDRVLIEVAGQWVVKAAD
jgi:ATP phosphoribosyltransferase regulatory subunit